MSRRRGADTCHLVALPNGGVNGDNGGSQRGGYRSVMSRLRDVIAHPKNDYAAVFSFDIPALKVGTLDKLMEAGDKLSKFDLTVEQLFRRVERQYAEVNLDGEALTVGGQSVEAYLQDFRWSAARYPYQRSLDAVIHIIMQNVKRVDDELREATIAFQEKRQLMNAASRKKGGTYLVADLSTVLTNQVVSASDFIDTEFLTTTVVVVPKSLEAEFMAEYETLDGDAVGYGPPEDRESVRGSPVVPRSAKRVCADKDGNVIYLVTILRLYEDSFKDACRGKRYTVRPFTYQQQGSEDGGRLDDGAGAGDASRNAEYEYNTAVRSLVQWCGAHYGEVFSAWVHVKAIRVFVESVMRYGLPVDFTAAVVWPHKNSFERKIRSKLAAVWKDMGGEDDGYSAKDADGGDAEEYFPYVSFAVCPYGTAER